MPSQKPGGLPTWVKLVLVFGALGVLTCGLIVGGAAWWFDANKASLRAAGEQQQAEARAFAQDHDADACVAESLRRLRASSGFMNEVRHRVFLSTCLHQTQRRPDFCAGVPARGSVIAATAWSLEFCGPHLDVDAEACGRLSQAVLEACDDVRDGGGGG
jgi:hypothetical protein